MLYRVAVVTRDRSVFTSSKGIASIGSACIIVITCHQDILTSSNIVTRIGSTGITIIA